MISEEEMEKKIAEAVAEAKQRQMQADYGRMAFIESISHLNGMVQRGEFPPEALQMMQICYQQFMGAAPGDGGEKPKDEEKKDE